MGRTRPEIIFVKGPQRGRSEVLTAEVVIVGRGADCDVEIGEETVSRRQMRFELTYDGWVVENLSRNRILINGRKYKAARRVLLETGDMLAVGLSTEILFVSAGDDPSEALEALYSQRPDLAPEEPPEAPGPEQAAMQHPPAEGEIVAVTADQPARPGAQALEEARKAKIRKYAIFFGVYAVLLIVGIIVLKSHVGGDQKRPSQRRPVKLTHQQIADVLRRQRELPRYAAEADEALEKALRFYDTRNVNDGDLYRAVKHFNRHLAFKGQSMFEKVKDESIYQQALTELTERVRRAYDNAFTFEMAKNWENALRLFQEIQSILPVNEAPDAEPDNLIFRNVHEHIKYVRRHSPRKRR